MAFVPFPARRSESTDSEVRMMQVRRRVGSSGKDCPLPGPYDDEAHVNVGADGYAGAVVESIRSVITPHRQRHARSGFAYSSWSMESGLGR